MSLECSYAELRSLIGFHAGCGRDPAGWTAENILDAAAILEEALNQFYSPPPLPEDRVPHEWSFLSVETSIDLHAGYSTGTVAIAANGAGSIVTLTSGTWPSWAASGDLWVNDQRYTVKSRTSNSAIVLNNVSVTLAAGETYELLQHSYDLPADFGSIPSNFFTYRRDQAWNAPRVIIVGENVIRQHDRTNGLTGFSELASLVPVAPTATESTRWQVKLWPLSKSDAVLDFRYRVIPPVLDATVNVYPYGGAAHALTIRASVEDMTFQRIRESEERHGKFLERLTQSVQYDRRHNATHTYGQGVRSLAGRDQSLEAALRDSRRNIPSSDINLSFG